MPIGVPDGDFGVSAVATPIAKPAKIKAEDKPYYKAMESGVPEKYENGMSQIKKTLYALGKVGSGYTPDYSKYLIGIDNTLEFGAVNKFVGYHLSKFYNLGLIKGKKDGVKNVYTFK